MSGNYDFCVTQTFENTQEKFHARYKFGDIDPGKEVARVLVTQRFNRDGAKSVGATDYDPGICPGEEVQEISVAASAEQLANLANAVTSGNVVGAAAVAAEIVAGGTVAIVRGAGNVVKAVDDFFKKTFG